MTHISNWPVVMNNKQVRKAATFIYYPDGNSNYLYNGEVFDKDEFESMYPIDFKKVNIKGDNPDKTKIEY